MCSQNYPLRLRHTLKEVRMKIEFNKDRERKGKEADKEIKNAGWKV
jgi:hypothetical protein